MESKIWDHVGFLRPNRTIYGFVKGHVEYIYAWKKAEQREKYDSIVYTQNKDAIFSGESSNFTALLLSSREPNGYYG